MSIELWAARLERPLTERETAAMLRLLPEARRERLLRIKQPEKRREPLCAYLILRHALWEQYRWQELPEIRRVAGTGLPSAQTGTFRSEDWGTFTCCIDPRQGPWLLIETVDGRLFLFNATDPAATEAALVVIGSTSFS